MDFRNAFDGLNIFDSSAAITPPLGQVSTWAAFDRRDIRGTSYGGFAGYNTQWDDAIIGVEVNYSHVSVSGSSSDFRCYSAAPNCVGPVAINGLTYNADVTAIASARITDYGTFRLRGGWAAGNFLPYAIAGLAVARTDVTRTATATFVPVNPANPAVPPRTESDALTRFTWGYSLGLGVDFLVTRNIFVRGEYEYIWLNPVAGIELNINTARVGAGFRF